MESNGQMTPMSARRMQDKSELTPQSLKWQGLVGGSGANKSPKSKGSNCVIPREYATIDPAPLPRPGPT